MKKHVLVAALALCSGFAMAQTMMASDGVMMKDGSKMMMKNGDAMDMSGMMKK